MGEVVAFAPREKEDAPRPRRRAEPQGYLLIPARILKPLAELEASVDAFAADHSNTGKGLDWGAYYRVVAIFETAARYQ
jgi:hypothetical protein